MGPLLRSCVEVREPIELPFGMVSGVGPGIDVLDGGPRALRGKGCFFKKMQNDQQYTLSL